MSLQENIKQVLHRLNEFLKVLNNLTSSDDAIISKRCY